MNDHTLNKKKQLIGLQTFSAASVNQGGKSQNIVHLCKSFHCYIIQVSKTELSQWFNKMLYWRKAAIGEEVQLVNIYCVTMRCYSVACVCVCVYTDRKTKDFQLLTKIWKLLTATRIIPLWCKTPTNPIGHVHSLHTWKSPNLWTSYNTYSQVHFSCMVCMHMMFVFDLINYCFRIFK